MNQGETAKMELLVTWIGQMGKLMDLLMTWTGQMDKPTIIPRRAQWRQSRTGRPSFRTRFLSRVATSATAANHHYYWNCDDMERTVVLFRLTEIRFDRKDLA